MTSVFNLTNGKRIVEESEIKDVLLHVSNEELLTLVEDFIMNYDVTLDELSFLLEWLHRNKVETPQLHISEECIFKLMSRDISKSEICLSRIEQYINYFHIIFPRNIARIYNYLEKRSCIIDLSESEQYPLKNSIHKYERLNLSPVEKFEQRYPIFLDPYYYESVFLDDIQKIVNQEKLSQSQKSDLIQYFENKDIEIIENKAEFIEDIIDNLAIDDTYINKKAYDLTLEEYKLTTKEQQYYLRYTKEKYQVLDIDGSYRKIINKMKSLNHIFSFEHLENEIIIKEFIETLNTNIFNHLEKDALEYFELADRCVPINYYSKLIITRLILEYFKTSNDSKLSYDYLEDLADEFDLYEQEYTSFINLFYEDCSHEIDNMEDYPTQCNSSLYTLCTYILDNSQITHRTIDDIMSQFNKYASSLSLLRFTSIFPELIDIANNSSQKGMRKIESFTNNLITNVSNILKTIK